MTARVAGSSAQQDDAGSQTPIAERHRRCVAQAHKTHTTLPIRLTQSVHVSVEDNLLELWRFDQSHLRRSTNGDKRRKVFPNRANADERPINGNHLFASIGHPTQEEVRRKRVTVAEHPREPVQCKQEHLAFVPETAKTLYERVWNDLLYE